MVLEFHARQLSALCTRQRRAVSTDQISTLQAPQQQNHFNKSDLIITYTLTNTITVKLTEQCISMAGGIRFTTSPVTTPPKFRPFKVHPKSSR